MTETLPPINIEKIRVIQQAEKVSGYPVWRKTKSGQVINKLFSVKIDPGSTYFRYFMLGVPSYYVGDGPINLTKYTGQFFMPGIIYNATGIDAIWILSSTGGGEYIIEYGYLPSV